MSDQAIIRGAMRVLVFVIIAKALVALRDVAIAWRFGAGPVADAYNIALSLGLWLPLFLAGAIGAALVPALIRASSSPDARDRFSSELDAHAIALALAVVVAGVAIAASAPQYFATGNPQVDQGAVMLLWVFAPCAGLTTIFYYLSNRLQARGSFIYVLFESSPAALVALAVVLLTADNGMIAVASGTVAGCLVQAIVLMLLVRRLDGRWRRPILVRASPEWNALAGGIGIMALGQAALSLVLPLDQYFAVRAGEGVPATFGYASRLVGLATSIGTLVLGRSLLPVLAELSQRDPVKAIMTARRWSAIAFAIGLVGAAAGWVLASPVVEVVFQRGSFSASDAASVTTLVQVGLLQLPFYLSGVAAVQWLAVRGKFALTTLICFVTVATKAAALYLLLPNFGAQALMLSTAVMYAVAWLLQVAAISRRPVATPKPQA